MLKPKETRARGYQSQRHTREALFHHLLSNWSRSVMGIPDRRVTLCVLYNMDATVFSIATLDSRAPG